jgi:PBSX family phage terminase large subunit
MNAFAALLWVKRDGIWYAEKEYYYSGRETGVQKTDQEYAEALEEWIEEVWTERKKGQALSAWGAVTVGKIETIIDPSAASFIALLKKSEWAKVRSANNAVLDGIRDTAVALQMGKIKILRSACPNWSKEAGGYVWDDTIDEHPVKEDDHLMDSMRYFVETKRISKPRRY